MYFNVIQPPSGNPAEADQTPAFVQVATVASYFSPSGSPLLSHSHRKAFSAALVVLCVNGFSLPRSFIAQQTEGSGQGLGCKTLLVDTLLSIQLVNTCFLLPFKDFFQAVFPR